MDHNRIEFVFIIPQWGNFSVPAVYTEDINAMKKIEKIKNIYIYKRINTSMMLNINCMTKKMLTGRYYTRRRLCIVQIVR